MSLVFVSEITEDMFENTNALIVTEESDGTTFQYAFQEGDGVYNHTMYVKDFKIDTAHPFIRRRVKKSILDSWEGKWASTAPLFHEYIHSKKLKHDNWMTLKIDITARRRLQDTDLVAFDDDELDMADRTAIQNLPYDQLNDIQKKFVDWLRDKIKDAYGAQRLRAYDEADYGSLFEYLPKKGETVMLRDVAYKIVQLTLNENDEVVVIVESADFKQFMLPIYELVLTNVGTWYRDSMGVMESAQDFLRYFSFVPRLFGSVVRYRFVRRTVKFLNAALGLVRQTVVPHFAVALASAALDEVPVLMEYGWGAFSDAFSSFREVRVDDLRLPLGEQSYVSAITGKTINTQSLYSYFESMWESTKAGLGYGAGKVKEGLVVAGKAVENIFYGVLVLGGLGIMYKMVE